MPNVINSSRPPSVNSGQPPVRTTTTSRRGGRRSRSPAALGHRLPPPMQQDNAGAGPMSRPPSVTNNAVPAINEGNPSLAAAAAAAAAAQTLVAGGGSRLTPSMRGDDRYPPSQAPYDSMHHQQQQQQSSMQQPPHPHSKTPPPILYGGPSSSHWPPEDDPHRRQQPQYHHHAHRGGSSSGSRYSSGGPPPHVSAPSGSSATRRYPPPNFSDYPPSGSSASLAYRADIDGPPPAYDRQHQHHRYHPSRGESKVTPPTRMPYGASERDGGPSRSSRVGHSSSYYPSEYHSHHHGHHSQQSQGPSSLSQPPQGHHQGPPPHHSMSHIAPPHHGRYASSIDSRGPVPPSALSLKSSRGSSGGTSLVIGGTRPIHVPKPADDRSTRSPTSERSLRSVFRGRPQEQNDNTGGIGDDESPQKVLLSLRTPTISFEDNNNNDPLKGGTGGNNKKATGQPSSPIDSKMRDGNGDPLLEKSPAPPKLSASLDMAPSFTLFNQSFDSFGDVQYFNVDSTLNNDSFGFLRSQSVGGGADPEATTAQLLHNNPSTGAFSSQFLTTANSGGLTLGYSPVNSFGNASLSRRPTGASGNMMILGGEHRSSTPTSQVMYQTYSSGNAIRPSDRPLEDSHLRMSVGSFGHSLPPTRSYGIDGPVLGQTKSHHDAPPAPYSQERPARDHDWADLPFYSFLRKHKGAFRGCMFLLPGLKAAMKEEDDYYRDDPSYNNEDDEGASKEQKWEYEHDVPPGHRPYLSPSSYDIAIAKRRVQSSICAFGGTLHMDKMFKPSKVSNRNDIFRGKDKKRDTATPPSISSRFNSRAKAKYEENMAGRYYENEQSRLSWGFEEEPPIELPEVENEKSPDDPDDVKSQATQSVCRSEADADNRSVGGESQGGRRRVSSPVSKTRYRCKLCGQPKQNHNCPYQHSLARHIGIMVYPAVNAFTADEPGSIAQPLSEMNNFIDTHLQMQLQQQGHKDYLCNESSPSRPSPDRARRAGGMGPPLPSNQVTPDSLKSSTRHLHSPTGMLSASPGSARGTGPSPVVGSKRTRAHMNGTNDEQGDLLFTEPMELKPEQFRTVALAPSSLTPDAYQYAALPLPYGQRKRLSDNLFSLSNEVPKLTDECAQVLREAREREMWDLAVAELMTQVVIIIHCHENDHRFEGLRQYLLTLGIAC